MSFLEVNGKELPSPSWGLGYEGQQMVSSARNANATVVGQKINRRMIKITPLTWNFLKAEQWQSILQEIEKWEADVTYFDPLANERITRKMYWGDYSCEIHEVVNGRVISYKNCQSSLTDMGVPE